MRWAGLRREAWLNVTTGTTRAVLFAILLVGVVAGLQIADLATVRGLDSAAQQFDESGASVLTYTAPGQIDPQLCDALGRLPDVRAAGAIRATSSSYPAALPNTSIPTFTVTPSFVPVLTRHYATTYSGVVLSREAAETLSARVGGVVALTSGRTRLSGIYDYPNDGRAAGYGFAMLVASTTRTAFDSCWVSAWPQSPRVAQLLRGVLVPGQSTQANPPILSQLNTTHGTEFDGSIQFADRITQWSLLLAFVAGLALAFASVRLRRLELAAALHLGMTRRALAALMAVESALWALPAAVIGLLVAVVYSQTGLRADGGVNLLFGLMLPALAILGSGLGIAISTATISENHLFGYFKNR
jgi:hypothetical protein